MQKYHPGGFISSVVVLNWLRIITLKIKNNV